MRPRPTLTERVKARVEEAESALGASPRTAGSGPKPARPARGAKRTTTLADGTREELEARSLRRVFREMRTLYRGYRRRAKTPAVPELRTAVQAFKRGQSLAALVQIAAFLDERKLLAW